MSKTVFMSFMRKSVLLLLSAVMFAGLTGAAFAQEAAQPNDSAATLEELKAQLKQLELKVKTLEEQRKADEEKAQAAQAQAQAPAVAQVNAANAAGVTAGKEGFSIRSADGDFLLRLRGYVQADGRYYLDANPSVAPPDNFLLRRVRPIMEGTVWKYFDFKIMPDFGQGKATIEDACLDVNFMPEIRLKGGKYKAPVGLERLQNDPDTLFIEPAFPTALVPNREIGFELHGDIAGSFASYAAGVFDGAGDNGDIDTDNNNEKDIEARLFLMPFSNTAISPLKGLGLGVAGTYGKHDGAPSAYKTTGQETLFGYFSSDTVTGPATTKPGTAPVFTTTTTPATTTNIIDSGTAWRISPQGYYYWGPFGLLSEFVLSAQNVEKTSYNTTTVQTKVGTSTNNVATTTKTTGPTTVLAKQELKNDAWQIAASYVLTGENASYYGVKPNKPFSLANGTFGAFEIAARYHELDLDEDSFPVFADPSASARRARAWTVGLNWYLTGNFRATFDFERTTFKGGAPDGLSRDPEDVILSRLQVTF